MPVALSLRAPHQRDTYFLQRGGERYMRGARERYCRLGMEFAQAFGAATHNLEESVMLSWALAFFIIAIIAAVFGFTGIAAGAAEIAKILFVVFVVLFLVSLVAGLLRRP
jgi:uncharacterized membrane protein YtjA (UPF0391 family)